MFPEAPRENRRTTSAPPGKQQLQSRSTARLAGGCNDLSQGVAWQPCRDNALPQYHHPSPGCQLAPRADRISRRLLYTRQRLRRKPRPRGKVKQLEGRSGQESIVGRPASQQSALTRSLGPPKSLRLPAKRGGLLLSQPLHG